MLNKSTLQLIKEVDAILNDEAPNISTIKTFFDNEGVEKYFFKTIAEIGRKDYLNQLHGANFLKPDNNPEPYEEENDTGQYRIPYWPVLNYLSVIAEKNYESQHDGITEILLNFIQGVIDYKPEGNRIENYHTDSEIIRIISKLPKGKISSGHIEFAKTALSSRWAKDYISAQIVKTLLPRLLKDKEIEYFTEIMSFMLDCEITTDDMHTDVKPNSRIYWLSQYFNVNVEEIADLCGIELIEIIDGKIKRILEAEKFHFSKERFTAIEGLSLRIATNDYLEFLVIAARDLLMNLETESAEKVTKRFLDSKAQILNRIALYAINRRYDELGTIFWQLKDIILTESIRMRSETGDELYELIKNNCKSFDEKQIKTIINWIENRDHNKSKEFDPYNIRELLSALEPLKNQDVERLAEEYKLINPTELKAPGRNLESKAGSVRDVSPHNAEELCGMPNNELVEVLKSFQPKPMDLDDFTHENKMGLARSLRECVTLNPDKVIEDYEPFLDAEGIYQQAIFQAYIDVFKKGQACQWEKVFEYALKLVQSDILLNDRVNEDQDNYVSWAIDTISDLIIEGTMDDNTAFDEALLPSIEKILLLLAEKAPSDMSADRDDIAMAALNSTRGRVYKAIIFYALCVGRLNDKNENPRFKESIKVFLSERLGADSKDKELYVFLAGYLNNLYWLDEDWVKNEIDKIFPQKDEDCWQAAFAGHLTFARNVYKQIYDLLKKNDNLYKAIDVNFSTDFLNKKIVQFVCIGYYTGWYDIGGDDGLIGKIIERKDPKQLLTIASYMQSFKEQLDDKTRPRIIKLWGRMYDILLEFKNENLLSPEWREVASMLAYWLYFIESIDEKTLERLKLSVRYLKRFASAEFYFLLRTHAKITPDAVADLLMEMAKAKNLPLYEEDEIKDIVRILYKKGLKDKANKICNMFAAEGHLYLLDIYNENNDSNGQ